MRTDAGRTYMALIMGDGAGSHGGTSGSPGSGSYRPANYMGLSADDTPPDATDTVLAGEIGSGTLQRAEATFAHTNGTDTFTLTRTFTSDQTVTIAKIGIFNADSGGTMVFIELLGDVAPLTSLDEISFTSTISL